MPATKDKPNYFLTIRDNHTGDHDICNVNFKTEPFLRQALVKHTDMEKSEVDSLMLASTRRNVVHWDPPGLDMSTVGFHRVTLVTL